MQFKKYAHNPPHLFIDGAYYFITGAVLDKLPLFHDDARKKILLDTIEKWFKNYKWEIKAWILFGNHYHLLVVAKIAEDLPEIIRKIHGSTSTALNRLDVTPGRQVWWNYWDTCIRGDGDYFTRMTYMYWNAVKHGVIAEPEGYSWSSFTRNSLNMMGDINKDRKAALEIKIEQYDDF